jgi:prepilin-type N-terminal cleavage/methylation domain-containing protein
MKSKFLKLKQRGISLLEVMLSLAIIAVVLVMATRYFGIATISSKVNQATSMISEIRQGYARYVMDTNDSVGGTLETLAKGGYITKETGAGAKDGNPWGGAIVMSISLPQTITFEGIPTKDCTNLANRFGVTCENGSVSVPLVIQEEE